VAAVVDIGQQLLDAALNGKATGGGKPPAASVAAAALNATPYGMAAGVLTEAVKDAPTSQTGQAGRSGGDLRSNWSFSSGDMVIQSKSSGSATTGNRSASQDASGTNAATPAAAAALAGIPTWIYAAGAAVVLLLVVLLRRR
jgi:hypothetical protein